MKSGTRPSKENSVSARSIARNDVFPVLFSPTSSVNGARRTVCFSRKQRKFSRVTVSIIGMGLAYLAGDGAAFGAAD